jgi:pyrimidine-nucleoside phosphorylase
MIPYEIIYKKREGKVLDKEEIEFMINGYTKGTIPDYQMSALLMAIFLKGMNDEEISNLTLTMMNSGDTIDLSNRIEGITVDKHSTGGVGDKISLILAPIVAAAGGKVPMMSGRGLGHTGGTLDKLEAIENYNTELTEDQFIEVVKKVGCSIIGQTATVAPADKKMYSLRDVTATVDCIPLIAGSIMSKKLAAGPQGIIFDVKTGAGAFMKQYDDAVKLAQPLTAIGKKVGRRTAALVTNMNEPLGNYVGNALEVIESVYTLQGRGPEDLEVLSIELAAYMLKMNETVKTVEEGKTLAKKMITSGKALEKFIAMVVAQGGNPKNIENLKTLPGAKNLVDVVSEKSGYVKSLDAMEIGMAALVIGAGREKVDSKLDYGTGIVVNKKIGDFVAEKDILATLYVNDEKNVEDSVARVKRAYLFSEEKVVKEKLIYESVE